MGSIEADDLQLGQNDENDLQPFFVLHKASSQRIERKSGGKARRRIDLSSSVHESLEKSDTGEADGVEKLRNDAFDCVWSKTESVIKDVLRNINLDVFNEIDIWVHESFDAITSRGKPEFAKVTSSFPIVTDAMSKQLFCGMVLTRNMEVVDDLLTFADLGQHLRSHGCHVANLSSFDFSPKNGISGSIQSLLRKFLMVTLDVADISALASWYAEQDNYGNPVVVIIEDLERCCGTVLSDFILMLSEWIVKLPILLILGVATTIDAPRYVLSSNALQCISPHKFILRSPSERLDSIIDAVLVRQFSGFNVGHKVATFLRNCFLRPDGTLSSFVRALKMSIIHHFSMEPLSFILKGLLDQNDGQVLFSWKHETLPEAMLSRAFNLPSYMGIRGETNGEILEQGLSQLKRSQKLWSSVLLCLYEAGKFHKISLLDLYSESLDPDLWEIRASDLHSVLDNNLKVPSNNQIVAGEQNNLHMGGFICQAIRKVRDLSPVALCQLLVSWETISEGVNEIQEKVKELQSLSNIDDSKNVNEELTNISRRHTTRNYTNIERDAQVLHEKAAALIGSMVRDYMQPMECIPFHEILCFKNVDKLQSNLMGDPRRRIQADLLESYKFLKCSCCRISCNTPLPSMHDTSIMYSLAQEHGDLINLHDWYQSFKATICSTTKPKQRLKQSPSPKKRKSGAEPREIDEASLQARFCRAVAELQITGLLRMPSKRRPDYVQRVAFGLFTTTAAPPLFSSSSFSSLINLSTTSFPVRIRSLFRRSLSHSSSSLQSSSSTIAMGSEIEWPANKVRDTFIEFFESKNHVNWKSSPVVPHNDPTLLFANAGMNQYKPIFLGTADPNTQLSKLTRACNTQKCIRAGGKHNDLDDVGKDTYHHTFFEMLGNWSFGDYFKAEAIEWAWELLTKVYELPKDRIYATYFGGDEKSGLPADNEAKDLWLKFLPSERVLPFGCKDNFWEMGDTGPCGPCTEIHFDRIGNRNAASLVNNDDPTLIEIWNLVFIQFNRESDGSLKPLPAKHVDTGMGFERLTSILQNKMSNYDTDVFIPIFNAIQGYACGASVFCYLFWPCGQPVAGCVQGIYLCIFPELGLLPITFEPSPLRFLMVLIQGMKVVNMFLDEFFAELYVMEVMGNVFPELKQYEDHIVDTIASEEKSFGRTLVNGIEKFKKDHRSVIKAIYTGSEFMEDTAAGDEVGVVLESISFYAEQGGQIYDTGVLEGLFGTFQVSNVQTFGGFIVHIGYFTDDSGRFSVGDKVNCKVDYIRRKLIAPNHTCTHMLNFALREVLGNHVDQKGSIVLPEKLRFDFSHGKPVKPEELKKIEYIVNEQIKAELDVYSKEAILADAKNVNGLRAVFREVYPDPVRIVAIGRKVEDLLANPENKEWSSISVELCGGTHISNTREAESFALLSEEGIAKGIRRVTAVTTGSAFKALELASALELEVNEASKAEGDLLEQVIINHFS
ncbi:hypothetical protein POM88_001265 [Heracleum sosnowskyi]|uniref:Alanine--tRNA ligase n=1 Tax=Heracleum sosnowskyi TaxID=360622 RepID=A0AAD8JBS7_9APIA|nr:hypothetical protein POM88_001265 [Heracleum sosnowskyi]